ncbi:hypothetical protein [Citricoccus nitrophenolicus]|uniref:hypothetical protein n=1 Tax=Citricoccus nitrophenolicus TaxID=863575 RepID=UPI0031E9E5A0
MAAGDAYLNPSADMSLERLPSSVVGWFLHDLRIVVATFSTTLVLGICIAGFIAPLWAVPLTISILGLNATGGVVALGVVLAWVALMMALVLTVGPMDEDE